MNERNGFVYSLWSGRFLFRQGTVKQCTEHWGAELAYFYSKGKRGLVSNTPGVIYNAMVWLTERDDAYAASLLIENENNKILQLQEKIKNHEHKINILLKGIEGEV